MITNLFLNIIIMFVGALFSMLDQVTTLPVIFGYDIDSALVLGVSQFRQLITYFWPLQTVFTGFLVILGYYVVKNIAIKFFLGGRIK